MIFDILQNEFPGFVIRVERAKVHSDDLVSSEIPFVIVGETADIIALHSYSEDDVVLIDKKSGVVSFGKGIVELGKFLFIYQYGLHFLYSRVEFDEKIIVKEPTIAPKDVVRRKRRKKVVKDDACKEALAILFPDFEIETDTDGVSFILAECSLYDVTEHLVEMGCAAQELDDYIFNVNGLHFSVNYEKQPDSTGYKVWLSL